MNATEEERQQAVKDLRASADLIEKNGWIQGDFFARCEGLEPEECPMCSAGALHTAVGGHPVGAEEWAGIQRYIRAKEALQRHIRRDIIAWNDQEGQTAEAVIKAMRDCADALEAV